MTITASITQYAAPILTCQVLRRTFRILFHSIRIHKTIYKKLSPVDNMNWTEFFLIFNCNIIFDKI